MIVVPEGSPGVGGGGTVRGFHWCNLSKLLKCKKGTGQLAVIRGQKLGSGTHPAAKVGNTKAEDIARRQVQCCRSTLTELWLIYCHAGLSLTFWTAGEYRCMHTLGTVGLLASIQFC